MTGDTNGNTEDNDGREDDTVIVEGEIIAEDVSPKADRADSPASAPRRASRLPWILSGLLIVFVAGLFAAPWVEYGLRWIAPGMFPAETAAEAVSPAQLADVASRTDENTGAITSLSARLSLAQQAMTDLSSRIADVEQRPEGVPPDLAAPDLADIGQRLAALEAALAEVRDRPLPGDGPAVEGTDVLQDRFARIEAELVETRSRLAAISETPAAEATVGSVAGDLGAATARLMQKLGAGQPYQTELLVLQALVSDLPPARQAPYMAALSPLAGHGMSGIATVESLRDAFADVAADTYVAAGYDPAAPWWQRLWANLKSAVVVRPTGDVAGEDAGAIIARGEAALAARDLPRAVEELSALPAGALAVIGPWLDEARMRLAADAAMDDVLALLQAPQTPQAPQTRGSVN